MDDDGGLQYWQQLGLQQQFDDIFNEVNYAKDSKRVYEGTDKVCASIENSNEPAF